jgi:hypothetical protein
MNATPGVGTVLPWEWSNNPPGDAPYSYEVPASLEVQPYTSTATFDGTGAGGSFVPTLSIYSQSGALLASVFPVGVVMSPGDVAEVTWLPPFGSAPSASPAGGGIKFDTHPQGGTWLYVETDGPAAGPNGYGMDFEDDSGNGLNLQSTTVVSINSTDPSIDGIELQAAGGASAVSLNMGDAGFQVDDYTHGGIKLQEEAGGTAGIVLRDLGTGGVELDSAGGGPISLVNTGHLVITGLPTSNPGGSGVVWNNSGVLSIT